MSISYKVPVPANEPIKDYKPNSDEKRSLVEKINELSSSTIEIPIIIDGKEIKTGDTGNCVKPYDHSHVLGTYHKASESEVKMAIESSLDAWSDWNGRGCGCWRCWRRRIGREWWWGIDSRRPRRARGEGLERSCARAR